MNLAEEIEQYIEKVIPDFELDKLSFVGHSLGGLIIRASLPYLSKYKHTMYTYMSFSSPHLGYIYS